MKQFRLFKYVIKITSVEEDHYNNLNLQGDYRWMIDISCTLKKLREKIWLNPNLRKEFKNELYAIDKASSLANLMKDDLMKKVVTKM